MKYLLIIYFLFIATNIQAKNYYLSSAGSDINDGLTPLSAWQTIGKMNTAILTKDDHIFFKRGDRFFGTILPQSNGITYEAYGAGENPVISGLIALSIWTNLGGNIWEATVPGGLSKLNTVIINGVLTPKGRYPNFGTTNDGYLKYTSFTSNSVTNTALTGTPSFTTGEIVIRRQDWTTDVATITGQSTSTINFTTLATSTMTANHGFFIQDNVNTLDAQNEWYYYDASGTKKIKVYSTSSPTGVQVATVSTLVDMTYTAGTGKTGISFKGIDFKGCN